MLDSFNCSSLDSTLSYGGFSHIASPHDTKQISKDRIIAHSLPEVKNSESVFDLPEKKKSFAN